MSPYLRREFDGVVVRTIRRGETIFLGGQIIAQTCGQFVRPRQNNKKKKKKKKKTTTKAHYA